MSLIFSCTPPPQKSGSDDNGGNGNGNGQDFSPVSHENIVEVKPQQLVEAVKSSDGNGKGNGKKVRKTKKGGNAKNIDLDDKDFGSF